MTHAAETHPAVTHPADGPPITVHVTHFVKDGAEARFTQWCEGIQAAARRFDENSKTMVFAPESESAAHHVVFSFSSIETLHAFWASEEGTSWRAQLDELVIKRSEYRYRNALEHWFERSPSAPRPPTYKMALVVFVAITPLVLAVPPLIAPNLTALPPVLAQVVITAIIVVLMSYGAMPLTTRAFAKWLRV